MIRFLTPILILILSLKASAQSPAPFLAYISDTQAPMWIEDVFLESNRNEAATLLLLKDLESRHPARTFLLGDAVNLAHKDNRWTAIDTALFRLRNSGCPVHACLGNHELMGKPAEGERKFQQRFPDHVNTGYVVTCDSIATVLLNSNFSKMPLAQVAAQQRWYDSTLLALDTAASITVVVVACHHPPYSDSRLVGSSKEVQEHFVPGFIKSKKCKL